MITRFITVGFILAGLFISSCSSRKKKILFVMPLSSLISSTHSVGGTLSGLSSGSTVVLSNNGTDTKSLSADGVFSFDIRQNSETAYSVSVKTQPANAVCTVQDGTGTVAGSDISSVKVTCANSASFKIGGTVSNLSGTLILSNNGSDSLTLNTSGSYVFTSPVLSGNSYSVSVQSQPTSQNCVIQNAQGTVGSSDISNIDITCTGNANGALSSGTIINTLVLTGGVTTFTGSFCAPNTVCATGSSGYADSATPSSVLFDSPSGLVTDGTYLYSADKNNNVIRRISLSDGSVSTFAGSGVQGHTDGIGTSAQFDSPEFLTTDGVFLYVADAPNNCIRRVVLANGQVTTLITDNTNLKNPRGMVVYGNYLYISEKNNGKILELNLSTNVLNPVASGLNDPRDMTLVGSTLYISDKSADAVYSVGIGIWTLNTLAGGVQGHLNGIGTAAKFKNPEGIVSDGTNLYICDTGNNSVRKIDLFSGTVSTVAGNTPPSTTSGYVNSSLSSSARFNSPRGITSDGVSLYVSDRNNNTVRKIN
ncbi:MAG TPA: hypothetical protein PKN56_12450 [Leptospiraceae bacterium]|nr:hypothetical protein [Leptospiraceae bacterium]HNN04367.1 hypothetical protein [Leptospiraceae bacterium]